MDSYGGLKDSALSSFICSNKHNEISKASSQMLRVAFITVLHVGKFFFCYLYIGKGISFKCRGPRCLTGGPPT
jgi:hypothetical protein